MKLSVDTDKQSIIDEESGKITPLYSTEAFELIYINMGELFKYDLREIKYQIYYNHPDA